MFELKKILLLALVLALSVLIAGAFSLMGCQAEAAEEAAEKQEISDAEFEKAAEEAAEKKLDEVVDEVLNEMQPFYDAYYDKRDACHAYIVLSDTPISSAISLMVFLPRSR